MESQEALFIKGFNHGFILEQYEPELIAKVLKNLNLTNEYLEGLSSGQREYQQERIRLELENLAQLRDKGKDREQGIERG